MSLLTIAAAIHRSVPFPEASADGEGWATSAGGLGPVLGRILQDSLTWSPQKAVAEALDLGQRLVEQKVTVEAFVDCYSLALAPLRERLGPRLQLESLQRASIPLIGALTAYARELGEREQWLRSAYEELEQRHNEVMATHEENVALVQELRSSRLHTVEALVQAMEIRDDCTAGHSQRVVHYSLAVMKQMGVAEATVRGLRYGVLLHDLGKIGIPDPILNKPGPLTEPEWAEMKRHPELGARLLQKLDFLEGAVPIVLHHHERFDGSGYPSGLKGEAIPLGARIFAVADTFDAMTTTRPYRRPQPQETAIKELMRFRGIQFDPDAVDALVAVWSSGQLEFAVPNGSALAAESFNHLEPLADWGQHG